MKIAVYDTYVKRQDQCLMHFDILVDSALTDETQIYRYGERYLASKGEHGQTLSMQKCRFCHIEQASDEIQAEINKNGFSIIEMENCYDQPSTNPAFISV